MRFGEKLSFLRKQRGMTQMELAEKLDISRQAVSRWEQGTSEPSAENLVNIGKVFDVSVDALVNENVQLQAETAVQVAVMDRDKCDNVKSNNERNAVDTIKNLILATCTILSIAVSAAAIYFVAFRESEDDLIRMTDVDPEYVDPEYVDPLEVIGWPGEWSRSEE